MREEEQQAGDPRQFRVIDLFALTTLVALVLAMATPLVGPMKQADVRQLIMALSLQWIAASGAMVYAGNRRGQLLERSGRRMGVGNCGSIGWKHWPVTKSAIIMSGMAAFQLSAAVALINQGNPSGGNPISFIYQLQLGLFAGFWAARYLWRVYPNTLEFFERGVSIGGTLFIPWEQIELRPSRYFVDRLVLVLRPTVVSTVAQTRVVEVSEALRARILAASDLDTDRRLS